MLYNVEEVWQRRVEGNTMVWLRRKDVEDFE